MRTVIATALTAALLTTPANAGKDEDEKEAGWKKEATT